MLMTNGYCKGCERGYEASVDGRSCIKKVCSQRQIIDSNGLCKDCEGNFKPNLRRDKCI